MSNLNNNTTQLELLLQKVNELPAAGGADPVLQDKTVTPTTSTQTVTADSGYDGLDTVTVNAMPTATQATPTISVSSSGLITASATQTAGYVTAGTKSATKQLTTQAAKTITPSTSSQTAVAKDVYTTGVVTVAAIPSNYEDVATETSAYTTKLASLETAIVALENELEGKAGGSSGGGSVDTCTVVSNIAPYPVVVTKYENGKYLPGYTTKSGSTNMYYGTIENVVCGSSIVIPHDSSYSITASGAERIYTDNVFFIILNITAAAGETVTLSATYLD